MRVYFLEACAWIDSPKSNDAIWIILCVLFLVLVLTERWRMRPERTEIAPPRMPQKRVSRRRAPSEPIRPSKLQ